MHYAFLVLASIASTTVAQLATGCAAQNILDACKSTEQAQVDSCASSDVSCLCTQYGNLLTCYNNCPNDQGVNTVQQSYNQACSAASVQSSSSAAISASIASASDAAASSAASAASESMASVSASATSNSAYSGIPNSSTTATRVATTTENATRTASATASATPSATENAAAPTGSVDNVAFVVLAGLGLLAW